MQGVAVDVGVLVDVALVLLPIAEVSMLVGVDIRRCDNSSHRRDRG